MPDGANTDMLLVGWLTCDQTIVANTGFHFGSSIFQLDDPSLDDLLRDVLQPAGVDSTYIDAALGSARGDQARSVNADPRDQPTDYVHNCLWRDIDDE